MHYKSRQTRGAIQAILAGFQLFSSRMLTCILEPNLSCIYSFAACLVVCGYPTASSRQPPPYTCRTSNFHPSRCHRSICSFFERLPCIAYGCLAHRRITTVECVWAERRPSNPLGLGRKNDISMESSKFICWDNSVILFFLVSVAILMDAPNIVKER